jgi:Tol biopolymer transport system component
VATVDVESRRIATLTNRPDRAEGEPVWSPDGRFVAYGFREDRPYGGWRGVATMPSGGGQERVVIPVVRTAFAARASWSADGRWVAAAGGHGGSVPLTVAAPRGRPRIEIGDQTHWLAWSRRGATLAYALPTGIRLVRPGERPRPVRGLTRADLTPRFLSWSPDGRAIAFAGSSDLTVVEVGSGGRRSLYAPKADETVGEVAWSPDGRRIAFVVSRASPES